jgi:hypothetical protein
MIKRIFYIYTSSFPSYSHVVPQPHMTKSLVNLPIERVESVIVLIRGEKVILDADLAALYGVSTKRLNEQVRRNRERFPEDFMFKLTAEESGTLRSQIATSRSHGGRLSWLRTF